MISARDINLNPVKFDLNSVDSVLMPNECVITLPEMCTVISVQQVFFLENSYTVDKPTENKKE